MRTERIEGSKYSGFRPVTEIAKDIRRDIKDEVAAGRLPKDLKASVTSNYYAGGQSIDLRWHAPTSPTHKVGCWAHRRDEELCGTCTLTVVLSTLGEEIERRLKVIAHAYNYDNSDPTVDYFDTLFYCTPQQDYRYKLTAANFADLEPRVAETFVTLHLKDRTPAREALEMAQKLEAQS